MLRDRGASIVCRRDRRLPESIGYICRCAHNLLNEIRSIKSKRLATLCTLSLLQVQLRSDSSDVSALHPNWLRSALALGTTSESPSLISVEVGLWYAL